MRTATAPRTRRAPPKAIAPLSCAALVLAGTWLGPLPALARHSFAAHMAMHTALVALAAPLLAAALAASALDPVRRMPHLFPPVALAMGDLLVVWGWHVPALHHLARGSAPGLVAEQASFLLAATWVWTSALGGGARRGGNRAAAGMLALLLGFMHMVLLGVLLAVAPRPVYAHGARPPGFDALFDQHLGGAVMIAGSLAWLAGGLYLAAALLRGRGAGGPR